MTRVNFIVQPSARTTLDSITSIIEGNAIEELDVAVAYVTSSGAHDLLGRASAAAGTTWPGLRKRWITSFDYCRTEPVALEALLTIPNSAVRIYDAAFCLSHGCIPKIPFHPKSFLLRGRAHDFAMTGSGNLSRSGLSKGVEAGLSIEVSRVPPTEPTGLEAIRALRGWFADTWAHATPLNPALLRNYNAVFEQTETLKAPSPTEDDVASTDLGGGALSSGSLRKLRVCRNLWIDAGNITKNRGPRLPGNQLMMKRLSRVFFGFSPAALVENTLIGHVELAFKGGASAKFTLTYSDNKMDKLVLPIPGIGGPDHYDNETLLFRRIAPGAFQISIGSKAEKNVWLKRSESISGAFRMSSGRTWGVF